MPKECSSGRAPIRNTSSYALTKTEFRSIFGSPNDTVIEDFFFFGGETTKQISIPSDFCFQALGDYEDISNLEILLSLLSIGGVVTTAIALLLPYLKVVRNVDRFLQSSRVCDCQRVSSTEPVPNPSPTPDPNPNDPPPDTCCTECFQSYAAGVEQANQGRFAALDAFEAANPELIRSPNTQVPISEPYGWITLPCSQEGFPCQIFDYVEEAGIYLVAATGLAFLTGQFQQTVRWLGATKLIYRDFCENEPQPTPTPTPTPTPLPEDNFNFCEQFPALCNACPDVGNSQDVVVSGKIASTCAVKDDISFNVKF